MRTPSATSTSASSRYPSPSSARASWRALPECPPSAGTAWRRSARLRSRRTATRQPRGTCIASWGWPDEPNRLANHLHAKVPLTGHAEVPARPVQDRRIRRTQLHREPKVLEAHRHLPAREGRDAKDQVSVAARGVQHQGRACMSFARVTISSWSTSARTWQGRTPSTRACSAGGNSAGRLRAPRSGESEARADSGVVRSSPSSEFDIAARTTGFVVSPPPRAACRRTAPL